MHEIKNKEWASNDFEIRIVLTKQCNLKCSYCFEDHGDTVFDPSYEFYDMIRDNVGDSNLIISFSGGEPLLEIDLLIFILANVSKIKRPYHVDIQTNGTLIKKHIKKLRLISKMYPLNLRTTVHHSNKMDEVISNIKLLKEHKIQNESILLFDDNYIYSLEEKMQLNLIEYEIVSLYEQMDHFHLYPCANSELLYNDVDITWNDLYKMNQFNFKGWTCESGNDLMIVDVDNQCYICSMYYLNKINGVSLSDYYRHNTTCTNSKCICLTSKRYKRDSTI